MVWGFKDVQVVRTPASVRADGRQISQGCGAVVSVQEPCRRHLLVDLEQQAWSFLQNDQ